MAPVSAQRAVKSSSATSTVTVTAIPAGLTAPGLSFNFAPSLPYKNAKSGLAITSDLV